MHKKEWNNSTVIEHHNCLSPLNHKIYGDANNQKMIFFFFVARSNTFAQQQKYFAM